MHSTRRSLAAAIAVALSAAIPAAASAQAYPARPITTIVSFPPGGVTDAVARALATELSSAMGQSIVIQNTAGAGGAIGTAAIAAAPSHGYTLGFVAAASLTTLPSLQPVPYRLDSFDYVCRTFEVPVFVLVAQASPLKSLADLIASAKRSPGKLNYATVGPGSLPHLAALDFARASGVELNHVPYKGEGPAVTDLLGGHVDVYFGTSAVASTHNLRRLAVAARARIDESPDTPTLTESGLPVTWAIMGGLIAPKGLEPSVLARLRGACGEAVRQPAFTAALRRLKVAPAYADGPEFEKALRAEAAGSSEILRGVGLLKVQ